MVDSVLGTVSKFQWLWTKFKDIKKVVSLEYFTAKNLKKLWRESNIKEK